MSKKILIEESCKRQGRLLQAQYGNESIPTVELVNAVVKDCGCTPGEVLITDRCYNRTNKGIRKPDGRLWQNETVFIYQGSAKVRYVGPNYPYTGYVYQKPQGEQERIVARLEDGKIVERFDDADVALAAVNSKARYRAYLVTYNEAEKRWEKLSALAEQTRNGESVIDDWNVANLSIAEGDRLFILKQGDGPRGIMGVGKSRSVRPELRSHYAPERAARGEQLHFIDGEWDVILEPGVEALLSDPWILDAFKHIRQSGTGINDDVLQRIEELWPVHLDRVRGIAPSPPSDEDVDDGFLEGGELWRLHRSFERNPNLARRKKLEVLNEDGKINCSICKFDFYDRYGDVGKDFIECHHLVPLSELRKVRRTQLHEVILVCSNCHRMLHRKRPWVHMPDELRTLVIERQGRFD